MFVEQWLASAVVKQLNISATTENSPLYFVSLLKGIVWITLESKYFRLCLLAMCLSHHTYKI